MVDASYAVPYEKLDIQLLRERVYVGVCRNKNVFINALKEFKGKKRMIDYLDEFYEGFDQKTQSLPTYLDPVKIYKYLILL